MKEADYQLALQNKDRTAQLAYCDYLRDRGEDNEADRVYLRLLVSELDDGPAIAFMRDVFERWLKRQPYRYGPIPRAMISARLIVLCGPGKHLALPQPYRRIVRKRPRTLPTRHDGESSARMVRRHWRRQMAVCEPPLKRMRLYFC
jgi:hypothetical protein